jgi:hypothetical protein
MILPASRSLKWILGILGTILLGAVGSGFWELFLRNICIAVGHGILTLITLGIGSVRDSFYVEVAKGRTDRVGFYLVSFTFLFLGAFIGSLIRPIRIGDAPGSDMSVAQHRFFRRYTCLLLLFLSSTFVFR